MSDDQKKVFDDLVMQESEQLNILEEANDATTRALASLTRIQYERRKFMKELMSGESAAFRSLELTPEMIEQVVKELKKEFNRGADAAKKAGYFAQEGMDFAAIEEKLRAEENKNKLASVYMMIQANSCPAVVREENGRFCIIETFMKTLPDRSNCVYDKKAQTKVGSENCNGNAVDQAMRMGISLMQRRIASEHLVAFSRRDQNCFDYIEATEDEESRNVAPIVSRQGAEKETWTYSARDQRINLGWRGQLWL